MLYVQYGCGHCAPQGWLNFDASPTLRSERVPLLGRLVRKNAHRFPPSVRYADVTRGLPVADASCIGVYASHVLEHLTPHNVHRALDETYRILSPGGVFRVVVPDLEAQATDYLEAVRKGDADAAGQFLRRIGMDQLAGGLAGLLVARVGSSAHLSMWDYPSLAGALGQHGFVSVRRAAYGDAADPAFRAVEDACRFEGACAIEAIRPGSHSTSGQGALGKADDRTRIHAPVLTNANLGRGRQRSGVANAPDVGLTLRC